MCFTRLIFLCSNADFAFALFFIAHFALGLTMLVVGAMGMSVASPEECVYPVPTFLVLSGSVMLCAVVCPLVSLLNAGLLVWGTLMVFGLYDDFVVRYRFRSLEKRIVERKFLQVSSCDEVPMITAIVCIIFTWAFYLYFCLWMMMECEIGTKFKQYKLAEGGQKILPVSKNPLPAKEYRAPV